MSTQIRCAGCQRPFTPSRSDALTCSVRCRVAAWRRRHDTTAPVQPDQPVASVLPIGSNLATEPEDLDGWRRVPGGYVVPPRTSRNTFFVDPDALRRL
jgi:hypothetical protein